MARILVCLTDLADADAAVETALNALAASGNPFGLRFAVDERFAAAFHEYEGTALHHAGVVYFKEQAGLAGIRSLITDETCFLLLQGAYGFSEKWDDALIARFRKLPMRSKLLTGAVSTPQEGREAFLPALAENFEEGGVLIERGLPLVCAAAPVETLVADPALVFGGVAFLQSAAPEPDTLSIAAYVAGFTVFALERPLLWPLKPLHERRLRRPVENVLPGTTLARFEQLAGFRYEHRRAGVKTTWGLFGVSDSYAQQLPHNLMLAQRARDILFRARSMRMPLIVTAFIELPEPRKPIPVYILRFGFMKALTRMPLLLYTGGPQERMLRASYANTWSYPDNTVLPRNLLAQGMTREQHMRRSKLLLLAKAAVRHPEFTHVAWANIDLFKHPICPQAAPDFSHLMDERVHLATVNAIPDTSFMMVPVERIKLLVRELNAITQMDAELKRGFSEESLVERLVAKHPELFTLHPMPKKHLLMMTGFASELLCARTRGLLENLPPPFSGEAEGNKQTQQAQQRRRRAVRPFE